MIQINSNNFKGVFKVSYDYDIIFQSERPFTMFTLQIKSYKLTHAGYTVVWCQIQQQMLCTILNCVILSMLRLMFFFNVWTVEVCSIINFARS